MRAAREFPPNPQVVVFHTDARLTDAVVETYLARSPAGVGGWIRRALGLPGLRVLSINPYKICVRKQKQASWSPLLTPFERLLCDDLGVGEIRALVEEESRSRRFPWHGNALERHVYEGSVQASVCPVASRLFDLHGVAEVIVEGHEVQVRKCPLTHWRELAPEVERILEEVGAGS